jgi:hypothetical protein
METNLIIPPEKAEAIMLFVDEQAKAVATLSIVDATSMAVATERGQEIRRAIKKLEDMRTEMVSPLNEKVKEVNSKFKFFSEPLNNAKNLLNDKMVAFQREEMRKAQALREEAERKIREEQQRIAEERAEIERKRLETERRLANEQLSAKQKEYAQRKLQEDVARAKELAEMEAAQDISLAMIPDEPQQTTRTQSGAKATFKKRWVWEVINTDEVPREFLCIDEAAVKKAIAMGVRDIPGIRIYQNINVSQ